MNILLSYELVPMDNQSHTVHGQSDAPTKPQVFLATLINGLSRNFDFFFLWLLRR